MKYSKPLLFDLNGTQAMGVCNDGSSAGLGADGCIMGLLNTDASCHYGDDPGIGSDHHCLNGGTAYNSCGFGNSAGNNLALCGVGGDFYSI